MNTLRPGDIFCTRNPMMLGRAINAAQTFISVDNKSRYSHSGLIFDSHGQTFEALWTNKKQNLFRAYAGKQILIGRHSQMSADKFTRGWKNIAHHEGKLYAGHRLLFFLICPPLAKYLSLGLGVCSELTAKHWYHAGLLSHWKGVYPDYLADIIHNWRHIDVVFEGKCPASLAQLELVVAQKKKPVDAVAADRLRAVYQNLETILERQCKKSK